MRKMVARFFEGKHGFYLGQFVVLRGDLYV